MTNGLQDMVYYYYLDISLNMLFYSFEMAIIKFFRFAKGEYTITAFEQTIKKCKNKWLFLLYKAKNSLKHTYTFFSLFFLTQPIKLVQHI